MLNSAPPIIIVAPSEIRGGLFDDFDSSSEEKSKRFNSIYRQLAIKNDCIFIDNQNLIAGEDGVHLSKESHQKLAEKIFSAINTENTMIVENIVTSDTIAQVFVPSLFFKANIECIKRNIVVKKNNAINKPIRTLYSVVTPSP